MNKTMKINRFDGVYAICEDKEQKFFAIELVELPEGIREGDVLEIVGDGTLKLNEKETEARKAKTKKK